MFDGVRVNESMELQWWGRDVKEILGLPMGGEIKIIS